MRLGISSGESIGRARGDLADVLDEGDEVAAEDFGEQGIEIGVMEAQGAGIHLQGDGQVAEGDVVQAVSGDEVRGDLEDTFVPQPFPLGGRALEPIDFLGLVTEDAGWRCCMRIVIASRAWRRGDPEPRDGRLPWDPWIATPPSGGSQ